ncbi:transposase [Candidatus Bipolaricaulota bacterium]|nr:transposase [Candidatus Bipolaricaulota bacterium]
MRALKSLGLPLSQEALQDALSLIQEKLSFYRTQPLKGDWFCVLIDGYRAKLRTDDGKLKEITLFVAVGIDLDGIKEILGALLKTSVHDEVVELSEALRPPPQTT